MRPRPNRIRCARRCQEILIPPPKKKRTTPCRSKVKLYDLSNTASFPKKLSSTSQKFIPLDIASSSQGSCKTDKLSTWWQLNPKRKFILRCGRSILKPTFSPLPSSARPNKRLTNAFTGQASVNLRGNFRKKATFSNSKRSLGGKGLIIK